MAPLGRLALLLLAPFWSAAMPEAWADGAGAVVVISSKLDTAGSIMVSADVLAFAAGSLHGEMVISRKGKAGTINTQQARDFVLEAGQSAVIASVGVSFESGDSLTVSATVTQDGKVVSQSELSVAAGQ